MSTVVDSPVLTVALLRGGLSLLALLLLFGRQFGFVGARSAFLLLVCHHNFLGYWFVFDSVVRHGEPIKSSAFALP